MAVLPTRSILVRWGMLRGLRSLRQGSQPALLVGAAAVLLGLGRRTPRRRVLYSRRLRPGAAVVVRNGSGTTARLEIRRHR